MAVIATLKTSVKDESVEVISAKLLNVRQVESLTKSLESAYISYDISSQSAAKYSTQSAGKALTKNVTNERVKLIMESGNFSNMNEVMTKFINSCTEATIPIIIEIITMTLTTDGVITTPVENEVAETIIPLKQM